MKYRPSISILFIFLIIITFVFIFNAKIIEPDTSIKTKEKQSTDVNKTTKEENTSKVSSINTQTLPSPTIDELNKTERAAIEKQRTPESIGHAWQDIHTTPELDKIKPHSPLINNIKAIKIKDIDKFRTLKKGDELILNLPNNSSINIVIKFSVFQNHGIRSWSGYFEIEGKNYPATFTFGESSILGFIGHPNRVIRVEGNGSNAWVYEVPNKQGQRSNDKK